MGQVVLSGNPPISIKLRRSAQARRISLWVSRLDGQVTLSLPSWTGEPEALAFARQKEAWIRRNLSERIAPYVPRLGGTLVFEGRKVPIGSHQARSVQFENDQLLVPGGPEQAPARIRAFLKLAARDRLHVAVDHYAKRLSYHLARYPLSLGVLHLGWAADVFLASDYGTPCCAGLRCGA